MATWRENRELTEDVFEVAEGDLILVMKSYSKFVQTHKRTPSKEELIAQIKMRKEIKSKVDANELY